MWHGAGADEVTFLNITAFASSPLGDQPMLEVLVRVRCAWEGDVHPETVAVPEGHIDPRSLMHPRELSHAVASMQYARAQVLRRTAETVFVPLCVGGGIRDFVDPDGVSYSALQVAGEYFRAGADKVETHA